MKIENIVSVDVQSLLAPTETYRPKYIVVIDPPSAGHLIEIARRHPRVFVFSFVTCQPEECPDFSSLPDDENADRITKPIAIGNFVENDRPKVIEQFLQCAMGEFWINAERIEA